MGIEVRGLDEAQRHLQEVIDNLDNNKVAEWFEKVATIANEICPEAKVVFERDVKAGEIGQLKLPDRKNVDCVLKAIDRIIDDVPEPTKSMLIEYKKALLAEMEKSAS